MSQLWKIFPIFVMTFQCIILLCVYDWESNKEEVSKEEANLKKYVGFNLNYGRLGNQLFHLITGYGIARSIGRTHYIPFQENVRYHVEGYLRYFKHVFPRLSDTYVLAKNGTKETLVDFAGSCCAYDNPQRLINMRDRYLLLNFAYGQNPKYFEQYIPEIRQILQFSKALQQIGDRVINGWKKAPNSMMCIHIRRGDFIERNIATDPASAIVAAIAIAREKSISQYLIFGDDQPFMRGMAYIIQKIGNLPPSAVTISQYEEAIDIYVASRMCKSFLISAVTSSFGWWLAFFVQDQDAVYYLPDKRPHADKIPSKELFLKSWRRYPK